jgi:hypothetical protein
MKFKQRLVSLLILEFENRALRGVFETTRENKKTKEKTA